MPHRGNTSIGQKITTLVMATSTVVLLLFLISAALIQTAHFRSSINDKLFTLGHIVGLNSKQSLTFNQNWETQKIVETLAVEPSIEVASVFNRDNEVVAHYLNHEQSSFARELRAPGFRRDLLLRAINSGEDVSNQTFSHITVYVPIFHAGVYLGSIFIQTNNNALLHNLLWFLFAAMLILGGALLIAFVLATRLQKQITAPLHSLTSHMSEIIQKGKYPYYPDVPDAQMYEINVLIDNFTAMLHQICEHEQALQNYSADLEQQVKERTRALEKSNRKLEHSITELNQAKNDAESASAAKSRFLANISHEIRTPMIGVLGMAELLQKSSLPEDQLELVNTIYSSGDALLTLLNDLLDISKIEAGKLELELAPCSIVETIDTAVEVLAESAFSKGLDITVVIDPAIPQEVHADAARLRQIVLNLVSNAIKFTHYGTIVIALHPVQTTGSSCTVRLEVRDTGIGISPDLRTRIFDAFTQGDSSTSREYGGTGLGLTIIKQLCELMGGRINISANKPHGTIFSLEIPFNTTTQNKIIGDKWLSQDEHIKHFESIGIVSPNKDLVEVLKYHFSQLGKKVEVFETAQLAKSGIKSLIQTQKTVPQNRSLLCIDNALPNACMNLAQEIKTHYSSHNPEGIPLTITCIAPHEWILRKKRGNKTGVDLFISKPIKGKSLSAQITGVTSDAHDFTYGLTQPDTVSQSVKEAQPLDSRPTAPRNETEGAHTRGNLRKDQVRHHILIAEDHYTNQRLVQLLLEQAGYTLTTVDNGYDVLNKIEENKFDLILMDCQMPRMDGYEATEELRRRNIDIPIIALTAHVGEEDIQRCTEAGMDDYLIKPFKSSQLLNIVQKHLRHNHGAEQV
jgi:signal transduction histidine kinase/DNA-binding response OmpR family regulator